MKKKINLLEYIIKMIQNTDFYSNFSLSERLEIIGEVWEEYDINISYVILYVAWKFSIIIKSEVWAKLFTQKTQERFVNKSSFS